VSTVPPVPMPDRDALLAANRRAALRRAQRLNAGVRAAAMLAAAQAGLRA
jgi:predicted nucleic acid-binding protein